MKNIESILPPPSDRAALFVEWLHFSKPIPVWQILRGCYACALLGRIGGTVAGLLFFVLNLPDSVAVVAATGGFLLGINCSVRGNWRSWRQANTDRAQYAAHLAQALQEGKPVFLPAPSLESVELAEAHCTICRRGA
ncbi:MAG: hypothetical protein H7Y38_15810 [Armatimonadetes bacterium]|nr:hypothetical protein [Armatimonadota bacterium]